METSTHPVSPLRQRMIEDMRMRKLAPKTQTAYIRAVLKFAKYLRRSPETASAGLRSCAGAAARRDEWMFPWRCSCRETRPIAPVHNIDTHETNANQVGSETTATAV